MSLVTFHWQSCCCSWRWYEYKYCLTSHCFRFHTSCPWSAGEVDRKADCTMVTGNRTTKKSHWDNFVCRFSCKKKTVWRRVEPPRDSQQQSTSRPITDSTQWTVCLIVKGLLRCGRWINSTDIHHHESVRFMAKARFISQTGAQTMSPHSYDCRCYSKPLCP